MKSVNSYQDIKTPEEEREEMEFDNELEAMLREFDPEEAAANHCSFQTYKLNCIRKLRNKKRY